MSTPMENEKLNVSESETNKSKLGKKISFSNDPDRFKHGVLIRGKFIGVEDVKKENGDDVCQVAMIKLKAVVLAKKEHKQRICVKVNLEGIEIIDEKTNQLMFKHSVNRISYIARDSTDPRAIGYIYKNSPNSFQYFAIKTEKQAQELFNNLKDLFEVVLEMRNTEKNKNDENISKLVEENENNSNKIINESVEKNDCNANVDSINNMNNEISNLLDIPCNIDKESCIKNADENVTISSPTKKASQELFDVFDEPNAKSPSNLNDYFSEASEKNQNEKYSTLLNELSILSSSSQPGTVLQNPAVNSTLSTNALQNINSSNILQTSQNGIQNPFGTFFSNQTQMMNSTATTQNLNQNFLSYPIKTPTPQLNNNTNPTLSSQNIFFSW